METSAGMMDWNDLRLFVLTARLGGLAAAARAAGVSPPTLGRRLQALEAATGRSLFERRASGYVLTDAGRDLLAHAEPVEAAMLDVERWRDHGAAGRTVRVSAGSFTSRFLAQHFGEILAAGDAFRLQLLPAEARLDIARRAADIGIRNRRPEEAWLAGQRIGEVAYAVYGPVGAAPSGFVASLEATTPSARWLRARHADAIAVEVGSPRLVLDLALAGAGRALLPCFVGDPEPGLVRLETLPELATEQWLVMHHEERNDPAVRLVARRIARLLRAHRAAFLGRSAPEPEPRGDP
jgi:DNA-binding transcriptional LysR family regulator